MENDLVLVAFVPLKQKAHPKHMLISDESSDKVGKNTVDRLSISFLVLKIFTLKVEKLMMWRPLSWYANQADMTSQLQH